MLRLLHAPHKYVSTCVSPADIHRSASGALVMLQTYVASTGCHLSIKTTAARYRIFQYQFPVNRAWTYLPLRLPPSGSYPSYDAPSAPPVSAPGQCALVESSTHPCGPMLMTLSCLCLSSFFGIVGCVRRGKNKGGGSRWL